MIPVAADRLPGFRTQAIEALILRQARTRELASRRILRDRIYLAGHEPPAAGRGTPGVASAVASMQLVTLHGLVLIHDVCGHSEAAEVAALKLLHVDPAAVARGQRLEIVERLA